MGENLETLRVQARDALMSGLAAAEPGGAVARALVERPLPPPGEGGRRLVIAIGRWAGPMARATLAALALAEPGRPAPETLVVTMAGAVRPEVPGAWMMTAGWPDPDLAGMRAAAAVGNAAAALGEGDRLVLLLSAGAEVLVPAPLPQLPLPALVDLDRGLRRAGAGVAEALLVRQQLSRLGGGRLLALAWPAEVQALVIPDGASGEALSHVGGGLVARPLGTTVTARALVELYGLWNRTHKVARRALSAPPESPRSLPRPLLRAVATNPLSLAAMVAGRPGLAAASRLLGGGPVEIVHDIHAVAAGVAPGAGAVFGLEAERPWLPSLPVLDPEEEPRGAGVDGGTGLLSLTAPVVAGAAAPRLAELALRFVCLARDRRLAAPWVLALAGTGERGGEGWVVDSGSFEALRRRGIEPERALTAGGAAAALAGIAAAIPADGRSAATGDLAVFVRG